VKPNSRRGGHYAETRVVGVPADPNGNREQRRAAQILRRRADRRPAVSPEDVWSENIRRTREHFTDDHGLPGTECETYCSFAGEVTHCPIDVTKDGQGPVSQSDPDYHRTVCWCRREGCTRYDDR